MLNYFRQHPTLWHVPAYLIIVIALIINFRSLENVIDDQAAIARTAAAFSIELRNGLVKNCEENGAPIRDAIQAIILQDIKESTRLTPDETAALFPNFPPDELKQLLKENLEAKKALLASVPDVNCEQIYPEPPPVHLED